MRVLVTAAAGLAIAAGLYLSAPGAYAQEAASPKQDELPGAAMSPSPSALHRADFDPFAPLGLKEGESMPPMKCGRREAFEKAVAANGGTKLASATIPMEMFWRGFFAAQEFTPAGYPIGEHVVFAIKANDAKDAGEKGKPTIKGVVAFTLGDSIVCNALPVAGEIINMMLRADGAMAKETY